MPKLLSVVGNVHYEPSGLLPGGSGDQDVGLPPTLVAQVLDQTLELDALVGSPHVVSGPLPASLVSVKVVSGGPVTLLLSGPAGSDQAVQVSEALTLVSLSAPFTAVKLAGTAVVELVVAAS